MPKNTYVKKKAKNKAKEFALNTPPNHWIIVFGYHIHKSFWGCLLGVIGIIELFFMLWLGIALLVVGVIMIIISIIGNIYTDDKPYFKLWDKYEFWKK